MFNGKFCSKLPSCWLIGIRSPGIRRACTHKPLGGRGREGQRKTHSIGCLQLPLCRVNEGEQEKRCFLIKKIKIKILSWEGGSLGCVVIRSKVDDDYGHIVMELSPAPNRYRLQLLQRDAYNNAKEVVVIVWRNQNYKMHRLKKLKRLTSVSKHR